MPVSAPQLSPLRSVPRCRGLRVWAADRLPDSRGAGRTSGGRRRLAWGSGFSPPATSGEGSHWHLAAAPASQLSPVVVTHRGIGAWPGCRGCAEAARRRLSRGSATAQWQLWSVPQGLTSGTPIRAPTALTERPRKERERLATRTSHTRTVTRGARGPTPAIQGAGEAKGVPHWQGAAWCAAPLRLRGSVVWPGVRGEQRLRAAVWGLAGGRSQALHGLPLLLLGLVVEQDSGCHQHGAHG